MRKLAVALGALVVLNAGLLAFGLRFTMADHLPHHYIAALRPAGRVTEFGDPG